MLLSRQQRPAPHYWFVYLLVLFARIATLALNLRHSGGSNIIRPVDVSTRMLYNERRLVPSDRRQQRRISTRQRSTVRRTTTKPTTTNMMPSSSSSLFNQRSAIVARIPQRQQHQERLSNYEEAQPNSSSGIGHNKDRSGRIQRLQERRRGSSSPPPLKWQRPKRDDLVKKGDYIYYYDPRHWDSSPIVLESHKLVFFTIPKVGCTVWKQLFRRMMGYKDWKSQVPPLPHSPVANGLKYLYNYTIQKANAIMTDPNWTRAIMVRDPKQRFLSAFLDKSVSNEHQYVRNKCCLLLQQQHAKKSAGNATSSNSSVQDDPIERCVETAQTLKGFLDLCRVCDDEHWRPQGYRVDDKYWPHMDVVGRVESSARDARYLLQRVGAWDDYGASGWGEYGNLSVFAAPSAGTNTGTTHATFAQWKGWTWYTPELEQKVERFFQADYENPLFGFERGKCITCVVQNE